MALILSKRVADASLLLQRIQKDPNFAATIKSANFGEDKFKEAVNYIQSTYSCGESQAEEMVKHFLRQHRFKIACSLSNFTKRKASEKLFQAVTEIRKAQTEPPSITIPPTSDSPTPKKVPVTQTSGQVPSTGGGQLTIDATPPVDDDQKKQDLQKAVDDKGSSRQQQLINGTKALKISIGEVAKAMYGVELSDENCDKVVGKAVELIANLEGEQTAQTVLALLSPLIKQ